MEKKKTQVQLKFLTEENSSHTSKHVFELEFTNFILNDFIN